MKSKAERWADELDQFGFALDSDKDVAAELRRLAAVEAELERIKALPPVAWRSSMGHGVTFKESIDDTQKALTWAGKPMWQPLIALGDKTDD